MDLAGFIEAPLIGPAKRAATKTIPPMDTPAQAPISLEPVDTLRITDIRKKERITSSKKEVPQAPQRLFSNKFPNELIVAGIVAPKVGCVGKIIFNRLLPHMAPEI